jgi:hypothetical protein
MVYSVCLQSLVIRSTNEEAVIQEQLLTSVESYHWTVVVILLYTQRYSKLIYKTQISHDVPYITASQLAMY